MLDEHGRTVNYLRLSVTDLCNYRCRYCMEEGGVEKRSHFDLCSFEELAEMTACAASLGVTKLRLTGGEPLVRPGIVTLVNMLREIPGLQELSMTTNGSLLPQFAGELKAAGLDRLNLSLDTLDPEKFREITRCGELSQPLSGLQAAFDAGFSDLKLNVVLMGGVNDDEIPDFVSLTKKLPLTVRFIELMPMGPCKNWDKGCFLPCETVLEAVPALQAFGVSGVSRLYRLPEAKGAVGLISPMSHSFCAACCRIRLTADGKLKPCLHSETELPLRGLHGDELKTAMERAILQKPSGHHLKDGGSDAARCMNEIGG